MSSRFTGLWRQPDFMKLWAGETISVFGSQITLLALPLTAVLVLKASPSQMGLLTAIEFLPFLLLSLFAGVWVDRLRRRPIMITADLGRAVLLGSIPAVYILNLLSIEYLYVVGLFTGVLTVFFDVAYQSYLPALINRDQLVEGNGKLEVSRSVSQITGPGVAGALVQLISAPLTLVLDALSFLASAVFIAFIRQPESVPAKSTRKKNVWQEIGEGLGVVFGNRLLRSIAGCTGTGNLFSNLSGAVYTLYLINELKVEPAILGVIFALGSIGALLGALAANRVAQRFGLGPAILGSAAVGGVASILLPLASGSLWLAIPLLIANYFIISISSVVYNINQVSLRQAITPHRLQGRMNASMRFLVWGTMPIGSLIGGLLGEIIGLRPTLWIGAAGSLLAFLWVYFSPVRHLREQPTPTEEVHPVEDNALVI